MRDAGIWIEDETASSMPIELSPHKGYDVTRQGNDVHTWSPAQIKRARTEWDKRYPELRPDHLMAKPDIALATKKLMSLAVMLSLSFVVIIPIPFSIRYHYGRKHLATQVASVMPLVPSPSPFFHTAETAT
jgi:hypothetical protein